MTTRIVVVSDSFKGSLSSLDICRAARIALDREIAMGQVRPEDVELRCIPIADGGEGTVECFSVAFGSDSEACDSRLMMQEVAGPFGVEEPVWASYLLTDDGRAIIEMASCAGLPLAAGRENPATTTTFGVGQLIGSAIEEGAHSILLGLGGSATNDAGCGMAAALGVRFFDAQGREFIPVGNTLEAVASIDASAARERLAGVSVVAMCDVKASMFGPEGAAVNFGRQKGADNVMIAQLDAGVRHVAQVMERDLGLSGADDPGAGAAGAMGAGVVAFLGGELRPGIQAVLDTVGFEDLLDSCDVVVTGEGRFDLQSLNGKVVGGVASLAVEHGIPVAVLAGAIDEAAQAHVWGHPEYGIRALFSTQKPGQSREDAMAYAEEGYVDAFARFVLPYALSLR